MESPTISVIMGVYNCTNKDRLRKSILSIVNQTYRSWEFIICDDGSTNDTYNTLKEIAKLDDRISIVGYKQNMSLAYALNYCIRLSKGKFIARQDDDDLSREDRFEKQIKYLEEHKEYGFVGCEAVVFDGKNDIGIYGVKEYPQKKDFLWRSPFIHPTVMFRKETLSLVGGYRVASFTKRSQDYDMFMRMYSKGIKGYNIQDRLYKYDYSGVERKRPLPIRINESKIRFLGFRDMGILWIGIPFVAKPLLVSLLPLDLLNKIKTSLIRNH